MAQYYTDQDRIDAQTMRIDNPNIVGSGYIQFPPQRPFEKPVQMQPPTVAHLEYPQEYQQYANTGQPRSQPAPQPAALSIQQPQVNGNARMPTHSHSVGAQTTYSSASQPQPAAPQRQGQTPAVKQGYRTASVQRSAGAAQPPGARHANQQSGFDRAQQQPQQPPLAVSQQQQPDQAFAAARRQIRQPTGPTVPSRPIAPMASYHTPLPEARAPVTAPAPAAKPTASSTSVTPPASTAAVATSSKEDQDDKANGGLSKAQKQRLRKKIREGKV